MVPYRVVDLGTKTGLSISVFKQQAGRYFSGDFSSITPLECLGIDYNEKYKEAVEARGYRFLCADLHDPAVWEKIPTADFFLAWDFLEHLKDIESSQQVLRQMLAHAQRAVWLRMPSFEQDEQGEGLLKELGLRWAWTEWRGHTSHFCKHHVREVLEEVAKDNQGIFKLQWVPRLTVSSTTSPMIVPCSAPADSGRFTSDMDPKPFRSFEPELVPQWDCLITPIIAKPTGLFDPPWGCPDFT